MIIRYVRVSNIKLNCSCLAMERRKRKEKILKIEKTSDITHYVTWVANILAGITIALLSGDNGILKRASEAKENPDKALDDIWEFFRMTNNL